MSYVAYTEHIRNQISEIETEERRCYEEIRKRAFSLNKTLKKLKEAKASIMESNRANKDEKLEELEAKISDAWKEILQLEAERTEIADKYKERKRKLTNELYSY